MDCNFVGDNLIAYIHGELNKKAVMKIHKHLSTCEVCVQEEIELRNTNRLLNRYQFELLPEDFDEKLNRKIKQIQQSPKSIKSDLRRIVYAIAATILIMIGIQFFGSRILKSTYQPVHFKDFPTTQAVFRSEESQLDSETSLKERFIERYLKSNNNGATKIMRED